MTPAQARARAQQLRQRAAADVAEAEALDAYAAAVERARSTTANGSANIVSMRADHRLAISAGRGTANSLTQAARAKGFTLRELAARVGCSDALLVMVGKGRRKLSDSLRMSLKREIGWPAD